MELQTSLAFTSEQAETLLAAWLGSTVRCTSIERLKGGMMNTVLKLAFDREPFHAVVKLNVAGQGFDKEARSLRHLREHTRFPCPRVYREDSSARDFPYTHLLLEALPGVNMWDLPMPPESRERIDRELALVLLELHSHQRDGFGSIGEAGTHARWVDVFLPRLREVRGQPEVDARLPPAVSGQLDAAITRAEAALAEQGRPTLVHGDIWAANIIVDERPTGWQLSGLVDPSAEYADVELELAYLEQFSVVVGPAFFSEYHAHSPLRPGYEYRRLFYWLHSYLVHVWLFEDQIFRDKTAWVLEQIRKVGG